MRFFIAIGLCATVGVFAQSSSAFQLPNLKGPVLHVDRRGELGSSPGCARSSVASDSIVQALNSVSANAACMTYVRLGPQCGGVWDYRESRDLPTGLWSTSETHVFPTNEQNSMIADARAQAGAIPAPSRTNLYLLTFSRSCTSPGGGMGTTCRIFARAHFGACRRAHS